MFFSKGNFILPPKLKAPFQDAQIPEEKACGTPVRWEDTKPESDKAVLRKQVVVDSFAVYQS